MSQVLSKPLVSIVVLNRNGSNQLKRSLPTILAIDYSNIEVIFVDDNSEDDSADYASKLLSESEVQHSIVRHSTRVGYCRGKNSGAERAQGEFLFLLDNDISLKPDCVAQLIEFLSDRPDIGLCGPVLYDIHKRDRIVGGGFRLHPVWQQRVISEYPSAKNQLVFASYISGAVMFVRRNVWDQLGGFDESSMFFFDDHEFGPRCWILNWKVAVVPDAVAYHDHSSRASHEYRRWRFRQYPRGIIRAMIRNYSAKSLAVAIPSFSVFYFLKGIKNALMRKDPMFLKDMIKASVNVFKDIPASLRERKAIRKDLGPFDVDPFLDF